MLPRKLFLPTFTLLLTSASTAGAVPSAPTRLCEELPSVPECTGRVPACTLCHSSTAPVAWNAYGLALMGALEGQGILDGLGAALARTGAGDADGDGVRNADELHDGTRPGEAASAVADCTSPSRAAPYDFEQALRRVHVLYCGRSPSRTERDALASVDGGAAAKHAFLDESLDRCLRSSYWREDGLQRLADARIRPVQPVGKDGTPAVIIGDYEWDYRLWTYVLTDDRDMRELLLADYHVVKDGSGKLVKKTGRFSGEGLQAAFSPLGQQLEPERRAGMITTTWFFAVNTMFSQVPRTTAAQAYRAYLGQDVALQEGIHPVPNEPVDVDGRGVNAPVCRDCHSTLDPMSYAFVWYEGIRGPLTGTYRTARASQLPNWNGGEGMLLGKPIKDARDFAEVAVASDEFKRNLGSIFLRHAIERDPTPEEDAEFEELWRGIPDDGWSANRLIHRIVASRFVGGTP